MKGDITKMYIKKVKISNLHAHRTKSNSAKAKARQEVEYLLNTR